MKILHIIDSGVVIAIQDRRAGVLVDHSDPVALAEALEQIYSDKQLRTDISQKARQEVDQKFSSLHMAEEYIKFYHQVVVFG